MHSVRAQKQLDLLTPVLCLLCCELLLFRRRTGAGHVIVHNDAI